MFRDLQNGLAVIRAVELRTPVDEVNESSKHARADKRTRRAPCRAADEVTLNGPTTRSVVLVVAVCGSRGGHRSAVLVHWGSNILRAVCRLV